MKYIDSEKLMAEIERRIEETKSMKPSFDQFWAGQISAFKGAIKIAESLQQDKETLMLEMCNQSFWEDSGYIMIPPDVTIEGIESLLKQVKKKLQQEQPEVDLDAIVDEAFDKYSSVDGYGQLSVSFNRAELYSFIKKIARKEE